MFDFKNFHKFSESFTVKNITIFELNFDFLIYLFAIKVLWVYTKGNTYRIIGGVEQHKLPSIQLSLILQHAIHF